MCVPCDDDVVMEQNHQIQKEETTFKKKGTKQKRTQHECDVCEKSFRRSGGLKRHVRIHTNEKPYECDVCEMSFRDSCTLKSHMRIHTNEKPYECDVCEMKFRRSDNLKVHMRRWH